MNFLVHWDILRFPSFSAQMELLDDSEMPGMPQEQVYSSVVERFSADRAKNVAEKNKNKFGQLGCFNGMANYMKQLNILQLSQELVCITKDSSMRPRSCRVISRKMSETRRNRCAADVSTMPAGQ